MPSIHVVTGPPCSGKTRYVREHFGARDFVYDFDCLASALTFTALHDTGRAYLQKTVIALRTALLDFVQTDDAQTVSAAWFVMCSIPPALADTFAALDAEIVQMTATEAQCLENLAADDTRPDKEYWTSRIRQWFAEHAEKSAAGRRAFVAPTATINKTGGKDMGLLIERGARTLKAAPAQDAMTAINAMARRELTPDEVYLFSVRACDDQPDRDYERFTAECLAGLAALYIGKTVLSDHDWSAEQQVARVYAASVEKADGESYLRLDCYMLRTAQTAQLIENIDGGIVSEVSVGCSVAKRTCSVCGEPYATCAHQRGAQYGDKTCIVELSEPTDAYEVSFVAVPAQKAAGVVKHSRCENLMNPAEQDAAGDRLRLENIRYGGQQ